MADTDYEKEIETYLERLRKISWYQRYAIAPALLVMAVIAIYQFWYSQSWWDGVMVGLYIISAVYNYYDSRRTFAKIMMQRLTG